MTKAKQKLYRTADDRVVPEGHPDAAFLLAAEGDDIPKGYDVPDELNVAEEDTKEADAPEDKSEPAPANKSRRSKS